MSYSSPYEAHLKILKFALNSQKGEIAMKSQKVTFQKSQNLLAENLQERPSIQNIIAIHSMSKAGYVTTLLAIVRTELRARETFFFPPQFRTPSTFYPSDFNYFIIWVSPLTE